MPILSLRDVTLSFGGAALLDRVSLQVEAGERICLLGRNGAGKSSLLRLLAGELPPDAGVIDRRQGLRAATLPQDVPREMAGRVFEVVAGGLGTAGEGLCRYHDLGRRLAGQRRPAAASRTAGGAADPGGGGRLGAAAAHRAGDRPAQAAGRYARGEPLRRVEAAGAAGAGAGRASRTCCCWTSRPTIWTSSRSSGWRSSCCAPASTLVFVTHDRAFLRALATRIVEIDRGRLFDFACDYDTFLARKEELLHAEAQEWARFDRKLAQEEVWIRQGIKARRTRNEGRVRALKTMREERRRRRERSGTAKLQLLEGERSGKLVAEATDVTFGYGERPVIRDFSTTVLRGDRIGIIGPNGAGKTTLLKLLLGELAPQAGQVRLGTNLQVLYFDQLREQLDPDRTVQQNLAGEQDTVLVGGQSRHVVGYLQDFLFTPDRVRTPVRILSGGERSRLLLARLFTREANVLVLDEPTNDLDLETLDLLEELLADFGGTVFLVSHDRDFLNRIVTSTLVFDGEGEVEEYVGGYDDWLRQRPQPAAAAAPAKPAREKPTKERPRKLTFRERQELSELPQRIEALEAVQAALHEKMADPAFYREAGDAVAAARKRLEELEGELAAAYARWSELEEVEGR